MTVWKWFSAIHISIKSILERGRYFPYDSYSDQYCSWDDNMSISITYSDECITSKEYIYISILVKSTCWCLWPFYFQLHCLSYVIVFNVLLSKLRWKGNVVRTSSIILTKMMQGSCQGTTEKRAKNIVGHIKVAVNINFLFLFFLALPLLLWWWPSWKIRSQR